MTRFRGTVFLAIVPPLLGFATVAADAARERGDGSIPQLDYATTCRATPPVSMDQAQTLKSCMESERKAKEDLPVQWRRSKGEWRRSCVTQTTLGGLASYVELITCLEMHDPTPPSTNRPGATQPLTPAPTGVGGSAGSAPTPAAPGPGAPAR